MECSSLQMANLDFRTSRMFVAVGACPWLAVERGLQGRNFIVFIAVETTEARSIYPSCLNYEVFMTATAKAVPTNRRSSADPNTNIQESLKLYLSAPVLRCVRTCFTEWELRSEFRKAPAALAAFSFWEEKMKNELSENINLENVTDPVAKEPDSNSGQGFEP